MEQLILKLPAPFSIEWLHIWVFCALGAFATAFIMIDDIDKRLRQPFIAKPIMGLGAGMALAFHINGGQTPPTVSLASVAFMGAVLGSPILTGLCVFISDQNRQNAMYKTLQDKVLPFGKDKTASDKGANNDD